MLLPLALSFLFGAIIGSFLNVCIYRLPAEESLLRPGSRCPRCQTPIRWHQNIPLMSYLMLGGRCRSCGHRISFRYPLVEALSGLLFLAVFWRFGFHPVTPVFWAFAAALVVITFIDLDHQIIPDVISLPGIVAGLFASLLIPWVSWVDSLLGVLAGGGILYLVAVGYEWLAKKEGMGGGDVKLLAMIGAFLGWKAVFPVLFLASLIGCLVGIPLMFVKKADGKLAIPFGPFLAAAAMVFLLWGSQILHWYVDLLWPQGS